MLKFGIKKKEFETDIRPITQGFEFFINELNLALNSTKSFSGQSRVENITDVKYYNDNTLVAGNRDQKLLYLISVDFSKKTANILDRIRLNFKSYSNDVTLINVVGNRIYTSFLNNQLGIVDIVNNKLIMRGVTSIGPNYVSYHGVTFDPKNTNIIYLSGACYYPRLNIYNSVTNEVRDVYLKGIEKVCLKQCRFLYDDYIVVSGTGGLISDTDLHHTYPGYVGVYKRDTFDFVDLVELPNSQMDDLIVYKNAIYFVRQGSENYGSVFKYELQDEKLVKIKEYKVGTFPHGLDIKNDIIACTSMGNSSIQFLNA